MKSTLFRPLGLAVALLTACGSNGSTDSGAADVPPTYDAFAPEVSHGDAHAPDANAPDANERDASAPDVSTIDAASADAGALDAAGAADATSGDARALDAVLEPRDAPAADAALDEPSTRDAAVAGDTTAAVDADRADGVTVDATACVGTIRVDGASTLAAARAVIAASTSALQDALRRASGSTATGLRAERDGAPVGRVYLAGGFYVLTSIDVPSNVRVEIDPSATLINGERRTSPVALFNFGRPSGAGGALVSTAVRNVTITAGDGCGGPGRATLANKPNDTSERNSPALGLSNITAGDGSPLPLRDLPYWGPQLATMWMLDLDGQSNGVTAPNAFGFWVYNAYDVVIERVFSLQNGERADAAGNSNQSTRPVMLVKPRDSAAFAVGTAVIPRESVEAAHRLTVRWHFNLHAPNGYGNNQVQGCFDCRFENLFSHGGTALRLETDGFATLVGEDTGSGPHVCEGTSAAADGGGFRAYANVDNLVVRNVEGRNGGAVVLLNPHCRVNGSIDLANVRGTNVRQVLAMANANNTVTGAHGAFAAGSVVRNVQGNPTPAGMALGQERAGSNGGWVPAPSMAAIANSSDFAVRVEGPVCWPDARTWLVGTMPPGGAAHGAPPCGAWPAP